MTQLRKLIAYMRLSHEMGLFASMMDTELAVTFRTSAAFYLLLPFMGLLLILSAFINGYQLTKAKNQNVDRWFLFLSSLGCAILGGISLYGATFSFILGFTFPAAPWFFFSSLILAWCHQLVMLGINFYRIWESPHGSIQRMHYMQAVLSNTFSALLLTAALTAVVSTLLFPITPLVSSIIIIFCISFTAMDISWRVLPHNWKQMLKAWFYLNKPDLMQDAFANVSQARSATFEPLIVSEKKLQNQRLFTQCDYSAVIRAMSLEEGQTYLVQRIHYKLNRLTQYAELNEKIVAKISLLNKLLQVVQTPAVMCKKDIIEKYPLAFQSFWTEKGEVEQLFDAVLVFVGKNTPPAYFKPNQNAFVL